MNLSKEKSTQKDTNMPSSNSKTAIGQKDDHNSFSSELIGFIDTKTEQIAKHKKKYKLRLLEIGQKLTALSGNDENNQQKHLIDFNHVTSFASSFCDICFQILRSSFSSQTHVNVLSFLKQFFYLFPPSNRTKALNIYVIDHYDTLISSLSSSNKIVHLLASECLRIFPSFNILLNCTSFSFRFVNEKVKHYVLLAFRLLLSLSPSESAAGAALLSILPKQLMFYQPFVNFNTLSKQTIFIDRMVSAFIPEIRFDNCSIIVSLRHNVRLVESVAFVLWYEQLLTLLDFCIHHSPIRKLINSKSHTETLSDIADEFPCANVIDAHKPLEKGFPLHSTLHVLSELLIQQSPFLKCLCKVGKSRKESVGIRTFLLCWRKAIQRTVNVCARISEIALDPISDLVAVNEFKREFQEQPQTPEDSSSCATQQHNELVSSAISLHEYCSKALCGISEVIGTIGLHVPLPPLTYSIVYSNENLSDRIVDDSSLSLISTPFSNKFQPQSRVAKPPVGVPQGLRAWHMFASSALLSVEQVALCHDILSTIVVIVHEHNVMCSSRKNFVRFNTGVLNHRKMILESKSLNNFSLSTPQSSYVNVYCPLHVLPRSFAVSLISHVNRTFTNLRPLQKTTESKSEPISAIPFPTCNHSTLSVSSPILSTQPVVVLPFPISPNRARPFSYSTDLSPEIGNVPSQMSPPMPSINASWSPEVPSGTFSVVSQEQKRICSSFIFTNSKHDLRINENESEIELGSSCSVLAHALSTVICAERFSSPRSFVWISKVSFGISNLRSIPFTDPYNSFSNDLHDNVFFGDPNEPFLLTNYIMESLLELSSETRCKVDVDFINTKLGLSLFSIASFENSLKRVFFDKHNVYGSFDHKDFSKCCPQVLAFETLFSFLRHRQMRSILSHYKDRILTAAFIGTFSKLEHIRIAASLCFCAYAQREFNNKTFMNFFTQHPRLFHCISERVSVISDAINSSDDRCESIEISLNALLTVMETLQSPHSFEGDLSSFLGGCETESDNGFELELKTIVSENSSKKNRNFSSVGKKQLPTSKIFDLIVRIAVKHPSVETRARASKISATLVFEGNVESFITLLCESVCSNYAQSTYHMDGALLIISHLLFRTGESFFVPIETRRKRFLKIAIFIRSLKTMFNPPCPTTSACTLCSPHSSKCLQHCEYCTSACSFVIATDVLCRALLKGLFELSDSENSSEFTQQIFDFIKFIAENSKKKLFSYSYVDNDKEWFSQSKNSLRQCSTKTLISSLRACTELSLFVAFTSKWRDITEPISGDLNSCIHELLNHPTVFVRFKASMLCLRFGRALFFALFTRSQMNPLTKLLSQFSTISRPFFDETIGKRFESNSFAFNRMNSNRLLNTLFSCLRKESSRETLRTLLKILRILSLLAHPFNFESFAEKILMLETLKSHLNSVALLQKGSLCLFPFVLSSFPRPQNDSEAKQQSQFTFFFFSFVDQWLHLKSNFRIRIKGLRAIFNLVLHSQQEFEELKAFLLSRIQHSLLDECFAVRQLATVAFCLFAQKYYHITDIHPETPQVTLTHSFDLSLNDDVIASVLLKRVFFSHSMGMTKEIIAYHKNPKKIILANVDVNFIQLAYDSLVKHFHSDQRVRKTLFELALSPNVIDSLCEQILYMSNWVNSKKNSKPTLIISSKISVKASNSIESNPIAFHHLYALLSSLSVVLLSLSENGSTWSMFSSLISSTTETAFDSVKNVRVSSLLYDKLNEIKHVVFSLTKTTKAEESTDIFC